MTIVLSTSVPLFWVTDHFRFYLIYSTTLFQSHTEGAVMTSRGSADTKRAHSKSSSASAFLNADQTQMRRYTLISGQKVLK